MDFQIFSNGIEQKKYINIVISPIGDIDEKIYKKFSSLLLKRKLVKLNTLTRFQTDNLKSPFQKIDWKNAKLYFNFLDGNSNKSYYYNENQHYKKIFAV
jgi:hypothetical protein